MKHLFIVNPTAGGHDATAEVTAKVQAAFQNRSDPYEIYVTTGPRDATRKIRTELSADDELRVYACGGDGTFNECVNGAALQTNAAVTPFPTGTGNDFCRQFGADAALFQDLNALLPPFSKISSVVLREEEFEKTPKKSIKRYLYQNSI